MEEPIVFALQAKDEATAIFAKVDAAIKGLGSSFGRTKAAGKDAENAASGMGNATPIIAGVGIAGAAAAVGVGLIAVASINAATDFQSTTADLAASAAITIEAANKIGDAFLDTAGKTVFSAQQQMAALAPLTGEIQLVTGHALSAADATTIMTSAMNLAEASNIDLGAATKDTVNVMKVFHLTTGQAAMASNDLYETARLTGQSVDSVASSVDRLEGRLGPLGPSLSDVSTLMVELNKNGVEGRMAMQAATGGMNTLLSGSKNTTEELKKLNVTVFDASGKFVGMRSIIGQLQGPLSRMTEQQRLAAERMLFGATAGRELDRVLLGGVGNYDAISAVINKHNAAQEAAEIRAKTFANQQRQLNATIDDAKVMIGEQLLPVIQQLIQTILPVVTSIAQWINHNRQVTTVILIAVGAVGLLVAIVAVLMLLMAALASPVVLIVLGIAALAAGFVYAYTHVKAFHDFVDWAWKNVLKPVGIWIGTQAVEYVKALGVGVQVLQQIFAALGSFLQQLWNNVLKPIFDAIGSGISAVNSFLGSGKSTGSAPAARVRGLQSGGIVHEPTLALLGESGPEAVVPLSGSLNALGGGGTSILIDLRGSQVMSDKDMDVMLEKINHRLVRQLVPSAGINIRR